MKVFFFSVFIMLFSLKSYAKKCFTVWRNYYSIKSYSTFSAKMFQAPFILYMVYCIPYMEVNVDLLPYMEVNVGKKKKRAKHGEMRWTFQKLNSSIQVQILSKQLVMQSCKGNFHLIWT